MHYTQLWIRIRISKPIHRPSQKKINKMVNFFFHYSVKNTMRDNNAFDTHLYDGTKVPTVYVSG